MKRSVFADFLSVPPSFSEIVAVGKSMAKSSMSGNGDATRTNKIQIFAILDCFFFCLLQMCPNPLTLNQIILLFSTFNGVFVSSCSCRMGNVYL